MCARYGMAGKLFNFVISHGVLELSIIFVAAGCGIALGDALIRPGLRSRKAALQERARPVTMVVLFSALSLVPAGLVEGFVSPYQTISLPLKVALGLFLGGCYWWVLLKRSFSDRAVSF